MLIKIRVFKYLFGDILDIMKINTISFLFQDNFFRSIIISINDSVIIPINKTINEIYFGFINKHKVPAIL